jgi:hypothetical protein
VLYTGLLLTQNSILLSAKWFSCVAASDAQLVLLLDEEQGTPARPCHILTVVDMCVVSRVRAVCKKLRRLRNLCLVRGR